MDCPACRKEVKFIHKNIEKDLLVKECTVCHGYWIPSFEYWRWLEKHKWEPPVESDIDNLPVKTKTDSKAGKICPECGHILLSAKVGYGCEFSIDKCNHCGGIWLDCHEWEVLKSKKLNDQLHYMFSIIWQNRVKKVEEKTNYASFLTQKLGENDYKKLGEFKKWVMAHKEKDIILSYIIHRK